MHNTGIRVRWGNSELAKGKCAPHWISADLRWTSHGFPGDEDCALSCGMGREVLAFENGWVLCARRRAKDWDARWRCDVEIRSRANLTRQRDAARGPHTWPHKGGYGGGGRYMGSYCRAYHGEDAVSREGVMDNHCADATRVRSPSTQRALQRAVRAQTWTHFVSSSRLGSPAPEGRVG